MLAGNALVYFLELLLYHPSGALLGKESGMFERCKTVDLCPMTCVPMLRRWILMTLFPIAEM